MPTNMTPDLMTAPNLAGTAVGHGIADRIEAESGRAVIGRLISHHEMRRVALQNGPLRTDGPIVFRQVHLVDQLPPCRPLAACWELIVPARLPEPVRSELLVNGEPLDRLLTRHGVPWRADVCLDEALIAPVAEASCDLSWPAPGGAVVEILRRASVEGEPVAVLIDELPLSLRRLVADVG